MYHTKEAFEARLKKRRENPTPPGELRTFFHISCMKAWEPIVAEEFKVLGHVGIKECWGDIISPSGNDAEKVVNIAAAYGVTFHPIRVYTDLGLYEGPTIRSMYAWAKENPEAAVLYLHSKGVSDPYCGVKRKWRHLMLKHVVANYKDNLKQLAEYDAVGVSWQPSPDYPHYSGNFWMARCDWIASLDDPEEYRMSRPDFAWASHSWRNRMYVETWLGSKPWHHIMSVGIGTKPWEWGWVSTMDLSIPGIDWDETVKLANGETYGSSPVRWWLKPKAFLPIPTKDIPPAGWSGWEVSYDNDVESGKRTSRNLEDFTPQMQETFRVMRSFAGEWSQRLGYTVIDDPTMHGGGVHVTRPKGWLNTHLDYDRHPKVEGKRRAVNLIAFLNEEWKPEWGGALVLCDPLGNVVQRIHPQPGALFAFEVGDLSYHGVEPITGPVDRVTAAVYYLSDASERNTRKRALFLPNRGKR